MADNFDATPGSGATFAMDEVTDGTLGTAKVGFGKIMDGTLDSTNKLVVNASGEAQTRDDDANTTLSSIDGKITAVNTGAVVVSSSALPSGAATAAKQPALGTAGTASADVITVQGKSGMTPLDVNSHAVTNAGTFAVQDSTTQTNTGNTAANTTNIPNVVGTAASAVPSKLLQVGGSDGTNARALKTNTSGQLDVRPLTSADQVTVVPSGTQTITGTVTASNVSGDVASAATDSGNPVKVGAKYNSTQPTFTDGQRGDLQIDSRGNMRVGLYANNTSTTVDFKADNADAVATSATANKMTVGSRNTVYNGSTWDRMPGDTTGVAIKDNGNSITVDAPVGTPVFTTVTPSTTGGWSVSSATALSNTKTAVKAGAGTFGGYMIYNPNSSAVYIQVWNVAIGSITVGTTTPTYVLTIPATSAANLEFTNGVNHSTEINVAATTTATGSTAPSTAVTAAFFYK